MKSNFRQIIEEICRENNINITSLSKDWVLMLEKDKKTKFVIGHKFDLNTQGIGLVADDKYALFDVLKAKNIPVIEHQIVYAINNLEAYAKGLNTYEYVEDYFKKNNNCIVLKPNNGTCGVDVIKITNLDEIRSTLDMLFSKNTSISMCPFYDIKHEYRAIMLRGNNELLYAKYLPRVIGDGKRTIGELLVEFNPTYFEKKSRVEGLDTVLPEGEIYTYNWKFNLSQGSVSKIVEDGEFKNNLVDIARQVCRETGLNFGSVDIIETSDGKLLVLEVNSGVMMDNFIKQNNNGYQIAKSIYKKVIDSMFEK